MKKYLVMVAILVLAMLLTFAGTAMAEDTYIEGDWELRTLDDGSKEVVRFLNSEAIEAVIPEDVNSIEPNAFQDCPSLISIYAEDSWFGWVNYDNALLIPRKVDTLYIYEGDTSCWIVNPTTFTAVHCVSFGHYPQKAEGTDDTPIQWIVLYKDESKALLLSRYALDYAYYERSTIIHEDGLRWENSGVRRWLNNDFLHRAFTEEEQNYILKTNIDNSAEQGYSDWSFGDDPDTVDQVFLLSISEAASIEEALRCCKPTPYIMEQADANDGNVIWWLRSPGPHNLYPAIVSSEGEISNSSALFACPVRPAIWVDVECVDELSRTMSLQELYNAEGELMRSKGMWQEAREAFYRAEDMEQVNATYYAEGIQKLNDGDLEGALDAFLDADGYGDANLKIGEIYYADGVAKRDAGDWDGAVKAFENAGDYQDAPVQIAESRYQQAQNLLIEGNCENAISILRTIIDYKDSQTLIQMQSSTISDFVFERVSSNKCYLKEYIGTQPEIIIPSNDEYGQLVIGIGERVFADCNTITSITIPDSVTSIGEFAFWKCTSLTSITIPDSVISIGKSAFVNCSSLVGITIPDSMTSIEDRTFSDCKSIADVILPDSVIGIGDEAFSGCEALTSVIIPDSVTNIGKGAFSGCKSLTDIMIPDSVVYIADGGFLLCDRSTNIIVNSGSYAEWYAKKKNLSYTYVDSISEGDWDMFIREDGTREVVKFRNAEANEAVIPEGITSIGENAFKDCTLITNIVIPDSVTYIGENAFYGCSSLVNISIPNSVTHIGAGAFSVCKSLTNIMLPDSITEIGDNTFSGCHSLGNITIPDGVSSIGVRAFMGCASLTDITIPDQVTNIGAGAFSDCSSLTNIALPNALSNIENSTFYCCKSLTSISIPDYVTSIGNDAFSACHSLTSITVPDSVTSIGNSAFRYCIALESISISASVTQIGEYAFMDCSSLERITIPSSVKKIGNEAFDTWHINLAVVPGSYAEQYAKSNDLSYTYANVVHEENWELSALDDGTKRVVKFLDTTATEAVIPNDVTIIGENAFEGCNALISVTIPEGITNIGEGAFRSCESLTSITIPSSVISIADYAFLACTSLNDVTIHKGTIRQSIGNYAFYYCVSLSKITIPVSVTEIGEFAFMDCSSLNRLIVAPDSYAEQYAKENNLPFTYAEGNP